MEYKRKLPVFKACCFCIPLRLGVIMIGYWSVVTKLFNMAYATLMLAMVATKEVEKSRAYMFYTLVIIAMTVYLVLSIMLLVGVQKNKPEYLRHFFISSLVLLVYDLVCISVAVFCYYQWITGTYLICIVLNFYLLLVVRSSYLSMEAAEMPRSKRIEREMNVCWDTMQLAHGA